MLKRKSTRTSVKAAAPEVKRRRGRPAKAEVEEPKRRRGRPAKTEAPVAKRRGRPAKAEAPAKKAVATAINTHLVVRSTQRIVGEPSIAKGCVKVAGMTLPLSVVTAVINDTVFYNHYSDLGAITSISEKNGFTAYVLEGGVTVTVTDPDSISLVMVKGEAEAEDAEEEEESESEEDDEEESDAEDEEAEEDDEDLDDEEVEEDDDEESESDDDDEEVEEEDDVEEDEESESDDDELWQLREGSRKYRPSLNSCELLREE